MSVLQEKMSLLPWLVLFILIIFIVIAFAMRVIAARKIFYPKRALLTANEEELQTVFTRLRTASRAQISPPLETRLDRLSRLYAMTSHHQDEIIAAINQDYGRRSNHLTDLSEIIMVLSAIKHMKRDLPRFMRVKRVKTSLNYLPGSNKRITHPKGVVGIMSPWNYPYQLAIMPAIDALAAGNRVMLKPSETAPATSALLAQLVATYFANDEIVVVQGGLEASKAFAALPFDHLLFTGSTQAGRMVAQAAAANLTPVTLELGGKSPALVLDDANLEKAAASIVFGKLFNSGQTCISPDYVLIAEAKKDEFIALLKAEIAKQFPNLENNPDYTYMINPRFAARIRMLLEDAKAKGARVIEVNPLNETLSQTLIAPHLVTDTSSEMLIMQEEIFGPLLVIKAASFAESIAYIQAQERPLSLYIYGNARVDEALSQLVAGGVTVNDCIWHMVQEGQPFGGIGASGQGAYHGEKGFKTFSHEMPVFTQGFVNAAPLLRAPYGKAFEALRNYLRKFG